MLQLECKSAAKEPACSVNPPWISCNSSKSAYSQMHVFVFVCMRIYAHHTSVMVCVRKKLIHSAPDVWAIRTNSHGGVAVNTH